MQRRYGTKLEMTPEVKVLDTDFNVQPSSTGAVTIINGMAPGTSNSTRIGQKIEVTSIDYKLSYQITSTDLTEQTGIVNSDICAFAIVYDRQSNGGAPTWSDIFTNSTAINAPMGHRITANFERFEVLACERLLVSTAGTNVAYAERHVRCNHEVRYNNGTAGTIADIQSGGLFVVFCNQNPIANVANSGSLIGEVRLSFKDM